MSQSAKRVMDPGLRSVPDNDGDSLALLALTATAEAFPRWPQLYLPATPTGTNGRKK